MKEGTAEYTGCGSLRLYIECAIHEITNEVVGGCWGGSAWDLFKDGGAPRSVQGVARGSLWRPVEARGHVATCGRQKSPMEAPGRSRSWRSLHCRDGNVAHRNLVSPLGFVVRLLSYSQNTITNM